MQEHTDVVVKGRIEAPDKQRAWGTGDTYVFTCAQNNTKLHENFWRSLMGYIKERNAELHVSKFVYQKVGLGTKNSKDAKERDKKEEEVWFDPRIEPYVSDQSLFITKDLVWCGELNILPTRVHPLSTLKTYTKSASGIIPHVKMRMDSIPTMKHEPARFMYTTGTVTQRNYIQRVTGQVAEFHHVFGALVVEVERSTGLWWARQINADADGNFYDLDTLWTPTGPQEDSVRVQAITHGDVHGFKVDQRIWKTVFSEGGVVDRLLPREQFFHDTIDFMPRNHHNRKDPHFLWRMKHNTTDNVHSEFEFASNLLAYAWRKWSKGFVVVSNHDVAIEGWLRDTAGFYDAENAEFWLSMNLYCAQRAREGLPANAFSYALKTELPVPYVFLQEDDSYKILGKIEAGLHGHLGPNGARGNPLNLRTVGKANTGHTHSAGIIDGVYTAGVYGNLDMGYNKGLSSWSPSMIVTYGNGKRAILTIKDGRAWRDMQNA